MTTHDIIVIGGGIAGLAAAYAMRDRDVLVVEATPRAGGNIRTLRRDGCTIDLGPDALVTQPPAAIDLCTELGIRDLVVPAEGRLLVAHHGALHALPEGLAFGIPRSFASLATTSLISLRGKLRAALDLVLPARSVEGKGLGVIVERRLGLEVKEAMVEPLIGGVYGGELDELDPAVVMPSLAGVRGSYIRALSRGSRSAGSPFRAPARGMDTLVDALVEKIGAERVVVGAPVSHLRRDGRLFSLETAAGTFRAERLVVATPPRAAARLLRDIDGVAATAMDEIRVRSSVSVVLAFERRGVRSASGLLVTRSERRAFAAASFVGEKWPDRVSTQLEVIRAVVSADRAPELATSSDDFIVARVVADLGAYLDLGPLRWSVVERFGDAAPIPEIGYRARVAAIRERVRATTGIRLAGAAWDGPGIAGCIRGARVIADDVMNTEGSATRPESTASAQGNHHVGQQSTQ